ncbi:DUF177 domain-containing protein [Marinilongibacter aquaticus]|uniref:YceD family protein n=1 Tax=Marinilongibacter aquaticus TaxID=2975157 RepID=UPI0021BD4751|nr:DUF177 domain-containing protein [Marinilongibacter aquaticus]UBM58513.1 DUF177 domain-containing protein [Marinilongibacter aquaticus]
MKKILRQYEIKVQGLEDKRHTFDFEGGDEFFASFDQDIVEKGRFNVDLTLDKSTTMLQLNYRITGEVELICDRTLRDFAYPLDLEEVYVYKFGDRYEEVAEDVSIVPFGVSEINVAQHILDYICLAIPMKRLHPDVEDDDDDFEEEDFVEDHLEEIEEDEPESEEQQEVDPRWAALQALKKKL